MKDSTNAAIPLALALAVALAGCSSKSPSVAPTSPSSLTAPAIDSPADDAQLDTLRPTLAVRNGSGGNGTRTYDFQIADNSGFSPVALSKLSVVESSGGKTSWAVDRDLNPSTRYYWRVRMVMGGSATDWAVGKFRSKVGGYNRPGELSDPLTDGFTIGERFGSTTFVAGRGVRLDNANSYVRYQLPQTVSAGEFSMEVEGLAPNGPGPKLKIFSMAEGLNAVTGSIYEMSAQYRGTPGNPDNCISFKAVMGGTTLEPDSGTRKASVVMLNPGTTYFWKATWSTGAFRLVVKAGGVGGNVIYDRGYTGGGAYAPNPHTAYLGSNTGALGTDTGSFPGVVIRNVWLSGRPRPASLGSAAGPQ